MSRIGPRGMALAGTAVLLPLGLAACAVPPPTGPTIAVMPGQGKTLAAFQSDDATCRNFASARTGGASPAQAAATSGVATAAIGTGIGAAAGAAIGSASGAAGPGAAIGAASGLLFGSLLGVQNSAISAGNVQSAYNIAYAQCMTAEGNQVPPPSAYPAYPGPYAYGAYPGYYYVYP